METKENKNHYRYPTALSIAGLDPSGGAGLLADVKTFSALGVYGMAVATALTEQNTIGVTAVNEVDADIVYRQIIAVMGDIQTDVVKIGMVHDARTMEAIADALGKFSPRHIVVDPVMVSSSGKQLMRRDALQTFIERLLPIATLITPNKPEYDLLLSLGLDAENIAKSGTSVLLKGGHVEGNEKRDILFYNDDNEVNTREYSAHTIHTHNTHGTGCTLSSAIAAYLALGLNIEQSVGKAKTYLTLALEDGADVMVGKGAGAMNHLFNPQRMIKIKI